MQIVDASAVKREKEQNRRSPQNRSTITTTNMIFCDEYLMTSGLFVIITAVCFVMFSIEQYSLVTKMSCPSLRSTQNRHKQLPSKL